MNYVFYDTETTGTNVFFDQIVQFAAILTDENFAELERFEIRCQLLPYIVPAPGAVRVTGVGIGTLTDSSLPTYYEMTGTLRDTLLRWSPAIFVGYNSIGFDELLLRQALYQSLHDPYLTNTSGNLRMDVMRVTQAVALYAPNALSIPIDDTGRQRLKLDMVAPANGFAHEHAHDALGDVEATIYMANKIKERAHSVWETFFRFAVRQELEEFIQDEEVYSVSDYYGAKPYSWLVTTIGPHPAYSSYVLAYDLRNDPDEFAEQSQEELIRRLSRSPKPVRSIPCNRSPIVMAAHEAPDELGLAGVDRNTASKRARQLRDDHDLKARLTEAFGLTLKAKEPSPHVESQIYDGFPSQADRDLREEFHRRDWNERVLLIGGFEDGRLQRLARRLVYVHAPGLLDDAQRGQIERSLASRLLGLEGDESWLTLTRALQEADDLLAAANGEEELLLKDLKTYLQAQHDRWISVAEPD